MNYVYIVECSDGTFYTGWTNNLEKRIDMHSKGTGAKYTRGRGPVKLVYHEMFDLKEAMRKSDPKAFVSIAENVHILGRFYEPSM